jgi:hypothetical protein
MGLGLRKGLKNVHVRYSEAGREFMRVGRGTCDRPGRVWDRWDEGGLGQARRLGSIGGAAPVGLTERGANRTGSSGDGADRDARAVADIVPLADEIRPKGRGVLADSARQEIRADDADRGDASQAAQEPPSSKKPDQQPVQEMPEKVIEEKLNQARSQIVPSLGATQYTITREQLALQAQGVDAPFQQVLLRMPGVAQDSLGQVHVRGEHANLQYRINDVVLPEGVTGFGLELNTRFADSVQLLTGSLPAQYGFRTAGIVDIQTRSGHLEPGGDFTFYGGSYETLRPSVSYGGAEGKFSYFVNLSADHDGFGIENPTRSRTPIHDDTNQFKGFVYLSYILDDTSRIVIMGSGAHSTFQLPDTPGLPQGTSPGGLPWGGAGSFNSARLDENQNEQNYYGIVAYQKKLNDLDFQVAAFGRSSSVHFVPDPVGDLFFNGVASNVNRSVTGGGLQADAKYNLVKNVHTLRAGVEVVDEGLSAKTSTRVFPTDANGDPTSNTAFAIEDNTRADALFYGIYLQDEWKVLPELTVNFGARFDVAAFSFDHEHQFCPRVNMIYQPWESTTLHAGYAHYFTPPPLENVSTSSVTKFDGTSNQAFSDTDSPIKAERSDYLDAGVSQKILPGLQAGLDGYYKRAHQQIDDGFFGQTLILSAFNYNKGKVGGAEFTTSYTVEGFTTYGNLAYSFARGRDIHTAEFLFDPAKLAYSQDHWIHLDHDQTVTGSFGAAYLWKESFGTTRVFVDVPGGTGLRRDKALPDGTVIPNGDSVPAYYTINLGAEQTVKLEEKHTLKMRLDVVNATDKIYELRDGTGIGVTAKQIGMRLGVFGSLSINF